MSMLLAGKVQALLDRWTQTLATKLNTNLDAQITSRQSESSASTRYSTINGKIDTLDTNVDTLVSRVTGTIPTSIASVQSGTQTLATGSSTTDVTISAVNTSKSVVLITAANDATASDDPSQYHVRATLTSTTNLRLYRAAFGGCNVYVSYYVVTFS